MLTRRIEMVAIATAALAVVPSVSAHAATQTVYCDPYDTRTYTSLGWTWYAFDSGTIDNRSSSATASKTYTHTSSQSYTSTVSAEVGVSASVVVAEVNAKFGISSSVTASYTRTTSFTVTAPPRTLVSYKDGIIRRSYSVKHVHGYSNCATSTKYGSATVADDYLLVT